jgi:hypothetical protein
LGWFLSEPTLEPRANDAHDIFPEKQEDGCLRAQLDGGNERRQPLTRLLLPKKSFYKLNVSG